MKKEFLAKLMKLVIILVFIPIIVLAIVFYCKDGCLGKKIEVDHYSMM